MKHIIASMTALLISSIVMAQAPTVSGKIADKQRQSIPGATVSLLHLPDSAHVSAMATDQNGAYAFGKIANGRYIVKATLVGYVTTHSKAFDVKGADLTVPELILAERTNRLKEVNITSALPVLEQKADRLVVNVEKMNTAGDNALEILKKAPGVRLDKDDNILFHGNGGVNVMIDGKMTYMSSTELSNYLKTLPANTLSKIELMATPPANFDAAGTAGVINIVMKRNRIPGLNGTVSAFAGYGKYEKGSAGLNLNYNVDKLSLFARMNGGHYNSFNRLTINRTIDDEQYGQVNYWHPVTNAADMTIGADYFMNKKSTFGVLIKGYTSPDDTRATSNSVILNSEQNSLGSVEMDNPQTNKYYKYNANLNYKLNIDSNGHSLNFDADYITSSSTRSESFDNNYFFANGAPNGPTVSQRNNTHIAYDIYAVKADHVKPLGKSMKIETGWKSSWVNTRSSGQFDSLKTAGWITDKHRSNNFDYHENINAVYASLGKTLGNVELKAGLRAEQTNSTLNSATTGDHIERSYWKLFPTAFASWKITPDNQVNASYGQRISRPSYGSLNPFIAYSDPYTARQGNPYLQPSVSRTMGLSYTYKSFQIISLNYLHATNVISSVIYQNDQTKLSTSINENLGEESALSASSAGSFNIVKPWWNVDANVEAAYNEVNTLVQGQPYHTSRFAWSVNADQNFILPKNYKLQLSSYYSSADVDGLYRTLNNYQIDLSASKTFWNKNATISLKFRDIFDSSRFRSVLQYNNVNTTWQNQWESRRVSISFTYKFGNMKIKTARDRRTGAGSEEGRM